MFSEKLFWRNEKEKEENEDENFKLLYYLRYIVKSGIDGVPNPLPLQICRWFPTRIIIFEERQCFLQLIYLKNRRKQAKTTFFRVDQVQ